MDSQEYLSLSMGVKDELLKEEEYIEKIKKAIKKRAEEENSSAH